jgi:hypothetical protein
MELIFPHLNKALLFPVHVTRKRLKSPPFADSQETGAEIQTENLRTDR